MGAAYVATGSVFLAAVYARDALTRRQEALAWTAPWLAAVALWVWIGAGIEGGGTGSDWALVLLGVGIGTACYLACSSRPWPSGNSSWRARAQAFLKVGAARFSASGRALHPPHGTPGSSYTWPDREDLGRFSDRPQLVVQHRAGEAVPVGSEDDGGVQPDRPDLGLAVEMDGEVDVGEQPLLGRLAHADAVGRVDEGDETRQGLASSPAKSSRDVETHAVLRPGSLSALRRTSRDSMYPPGHTEVIGQGWRSWTGGIGGG